ncbi:conserved hypothetical protein [Thermotomaculum hydrothermale]|uniref:SSD domain-containing protein n=1 Tax=Thermotomaculum hydrothermale TaxID=981385 RepID=A0A7R6SYK2_9BACT|nr:conserved hypothetical protein [Thermotomaculum hydrothermale]
MFKHKKTLAFIVLFFTFFMLYLSSKIEYTTRIVDLLPSSNKKVKNYLYTIENIGLTNSIVVAVSRKDGESDPENIELYSEIFIDNLKSNPEFKTYFNGIDANIETKLNMVFTPFFLKNLWVIIPNNKLSNFINIFKYQKMKEIIEKDKMLIQTGSGLETFIKKDPLNILSFLKSYSKEMTGKLKISLVDGYYFSKDKSLQIFFVKTKGHADNIKYTTGAMNLLFKTIKKTNKDFQDEVENPSLKISVNFTGPHAITFYDKDVAQNDMFSSLYLSFILVLLIFILGFKNPFSIFYAAVPLIVGEVWTFGLTYLLIGKLNILTSIVGAILVGLGIDFSIHIYSRFLEEELKNKDLRSSLVKTIEETGFATIAGGLTTAAAFSSMFFSNFKGLREFGIVASLGIVSTLFACLLIIPLTLSFRKNVYKPKKISGFGTKFFHKIVDEHPKKIVILSILFVIFFLIFALRLEFATSLRDLRSRTNPALQTQTFLTKKLGGSLRPLIVVLKGKNQNEIENQFEVLTKSLKNKKISKIESIFSFIPPLNEQMKNIEYLNNTEKPKNISENFLKLLDKEGFAITDYHKKYINSIESGLDNLSPLTFNKLVNSKIYPLLKNYIRYSKEKKEYEIIVKIYPELGLWHKKFTSDIVKTVEKVFKETGNNQDFITGIDVVINEIRKLVKENFVFSSLLSLFLVFLIVYLHFRNIYHSLLSFIPLLSGIIVMLGALKLSGDNISMYNFIATPMIIGIGIDSGIHILSRVLNSKDYNIAEAVIHTGKAITFTSLTTIIGFGSLFISHFEGFKSLGLSTIFGVTACWIASIIFFPAMLKLIFKGKNNDLHR